MLRIRSYALVGVLIVISSACGVGGFGTADDSEDQVFFTAPPNDETTVTSGSSTADEGESGNEGTQGGEVAQSTTSERELPAAGEVTASDLVVGDCFQILDLDDFWADELVDCAEPHDGEVVFLIDPATDLIEADYANTAYALCDVAYEENRGTRFADDPGPLFAFLIDLDTKNGPASELVCALHTRVDDGFVGSFLTSSTIDVFQGVVATTDLAVGECFLIVNQTNVGEPVECGPGTLVSLGAVDSTDDFGDVAYPGIDVLRAYRSEKCLPLFEASGVVGNPADISGVVPDETNWDIHGLRLISCDIEWTG